MLERLRTMGLRAKLLSVCLALLALNSSLAGVLCYTYVTRDTLRNFYQSSNDLLSQINTYLNSEMRSLSQKVSAMNSNSSYGTLSAAVRSNDNSAYAAIMSEMADEITEWQLSDRFISSVYIYTQLGVFESFTHFQRRDFFFPESILYTKFETDPNLFVAWYPAMQSPVFRDTETVIPVVYKVRMDNGAYSYYIISLYQREIQKYLDETYSSYDYLFIVDADGEPITQTPPDAEVICAAFDGVDFDGQNSVSRELDYGGTHFLATHTVMRSNGWRLYALRSQESLTGNLTRFRTLIIGILVGVCLLSGLAVTVLVRRMTGPLVDLAALMDRTTQTKNFDVQASYGGGDEIGRLTGSFNTLLREIKRLIEQLNIHIEALQEEKETVKRIQAQKRKAEINALQAQINPHFLYNTLNAISWQAADQGETEISVLATSLGRFFRISLSKGREVITLQEEMDQVRSYLRIQKIRYKDILSDCFEIDPRLQGKRMIKLVVQPLVENAIYHGIKPADRPGTIRVCARLHTDDYGAEKIRITVEDDGAGIPPAKLAELNDLLAAGKADPNSGYGIFNVNERIKLYYGREYGLMLESVEDTWTRATLVFPAQIVEEGEEL